MTNWWKRAWARADNITAQIEDDAKDLRPDIRDAVLDRKSATREACSRSEIRGLASRLQEGETVRLLTTGNGFCLVVLTGTRMLVLNDDENKRVRVAYLLAEVSNISWEGGVAFGKLTFTAGSAAPVVISNIPKGEGSQLFELLDAEAVRL